MNPPNETEHTAACERVAVAVDGGLGGAALAAISAVPPGPRRELELASWAKRIAAESPVSAFVLPPDITDEQIEIIGRLAERVRVELGGAS